MSISLRGFALALFVSVCSLPCSVLADGYFQGVKGARASGRAGAFTVRADDVSAAYVNPAGLGHIEGTLFQLGNRFSHNSHRFTRQPTLDYGNTQGGMPPLVEFGEVQNDTPLQLLDPILGAATDLGLERWRFALAVHAPAGVAKQDFPLDGGQRYMMVGRDAQIIYYTASVAFTDNETFSVGASFHWIAVPSLTYQLVIDAETFPGDANPVSSALDMLTTIDGGDLFTPNATLGAWFRPMRSLELALSGQVIPAEIVTDSTIALDPLAPMIMDDVELWRGEERANDVSLTLPLPLTARVGVRYIHLDAGRELFDIELNVGYEAWSVVDTFTLETRDLEARLFGQRLPIGTIDVNKQWRDTINVQLGGDFAVLPELLTLRAGAFYQSAVADAPYLNVDFVSGQQLGGAFGLSLFFDRFEIALAYELRYAPEVSVSEDDARVYQQVPGSQCVEPYTDPDLCHPAFIGQPAPAVNAGSYSAASNVLSLGVLYRL